MPTPQESLILRTLINLHENAGMDTDPLIAMYEADKAILDSKTASAQEKKEVQSRQEALAKALPALATGIRDAARSFRNGDPLGGSAAVMEICTTLSTTIGALAAVPGPAALVGALFSIVAMALRSFGPPQKSLSQQLEQVIRTLDSEKQIDDLATANQAIRVSMDIMMGGQRKWTFTELMVQLNVAEGDSIGKIRSAAEWLSRPNNQDLPLWGQVLAAQCHTYSYFMQACTIATTSLDVDFNSVSALAAGFRACNADQLIFLQGIQRAAGNRGTVWSIGTMSESGEWPDAGHLYVRDTAKGDWKSLGGEQRVISVSRTRRSSQEISDPHPYLAVFGLDQDDHLHQVSTFAYRYRKNSGAYGIFGSWPLNSYEGWMRISQLDNLYDLCATPGEKDGEVYIYTADGKKLERWVHAGKRSAGGDLELTRSEIKFDIQQGTEVRAVCAVSMPQLGSVSGKDTEDEKWVAYAGISSFWIQVYFAGGTGGTIATPRKNMLGMKVDSTYLWVFTRKFIACVPHAAVKQYFQNRTAKSVLIWSFYEIPAELGGSWQAEGQYDGLHDLAPCDDGTLTAVFYDMVKPPTTGRKYQRLYKARPRIDLATHVITIEGSKKDNFGNTVKTNGWEPAAEEAEESHRVEKQPIFCWALLEGLTNSLSKQKQEAASFRVIEMPKAG